MVSSMEVPRLDVASDLDMNDQQVNTALWLACQDTAN